MPIGVERLVLEREASYILDIDIGNTRIKWRVLCADGSSVGDGHSGHDEVFLRELKNSYPALRAIRIACVAKEHVADSVHKLAASLWGIEPLMAYTQKQFGGLRVAYSDPVRLGVDRWLAMLAAYKREGGSICVVDCGSAVTVDYVDGAGQHRGGYIVPGMAMQAKSLLKGTGKIRFESEVSDRLGWGCSTEEAIRFGILRQIVSFVENVIDELSVGESVTIYLTGGDAGVLLAGLKDARSCKLQPDLVLEGLSVAFPFE